MPKNTISTNFCLRVPSYCIEKILDITTDNYYLCTVQHYIDRSNFKELKFYTKYKLIFALLKYQKVYRTCIYLSSLFTDSSCIYIQTFSILTKYFLFVLYYIIYLM